MKSSLIPKLLFSVVLFIPVFFASAQTVPACDTNAINTAMAGAGYSRLWVQGQPCSMYFYNNANQSANDARASANALGVNLVAMQDATENAAVTAALQAAGFGSAVVWIGGGFTGAPHGPNDFTWYDGTPVTYANWNPGEPNNSSGGVGPENCMQLVVNSGFWNDLVCDAAPLGLGPRGTSVIEVNLCPITNSTVGPTVCVNTQGTINATTIKGSTPYTYSVFAPPSPVPVVTGNLTGNMFVTPTAVGPNNYVVLMQDRYGCPDTNIVTVTAQTCVTPPGPQGCDLAAIRAAFAAFGTRYTELPVSGQTCSMYFLDNQTQDAAQAQTAAVALGANLAVMNDALENTNVLNALTTGGYFATGNLWIGYRRVATGSPQFFTLDGSTGNFLPPTSPGGPSPGIYQNWDTNEPNNNNYQCAPGCLIGCNIYACNNGEQCVQMRSNGLWNDLPCDPNSTSRSVIEVNLCPEVRESNDTLICAGGGATLRVNAVLGSQPYNYTWNPGALSGPLQTVFPAAPTTYTVRATDRYGCFKEDSVVVSINTGCNAPPGPQGCDIAAVRAAFAAFGGRYVELPVSGQSCSMYFLDNTSQPSTNAQAGAAALGANLVFFNDAAENANVVAALNAGGYLSSGQAIWIGVNRVGTNNPQFYALDGSTGNFSPAPPLPTLYQNWAGGEPNNSRPGCCTTPILGNTCIGADRNTCTTGEQCVQIYSNGQWNDLPCNRNSRSVVEVNLCPNPRVSLNDTTVCNQNPITLNSSTILGSPPYTFAWTPGAQSTASISVTPPIGATKYKIRSTDRYGCYADDSVTIRSINVTPPTVTSIPNPPSICANQNIDLTFNGSYSPSATANWSLDGGVAPNGTTTNPIGVNWNTPGPKNVSVTITDGICTSAPTNFAVTVNPSPIPTAGPDVQVCSAVNVTLGGFPAANTVYTWIPTTSLSDPAIANPVFNQANLTSSNIVQQYIVQATSNGCIGVDTVVVTLYPDVTSTFTASETNLCVGENDTFTYTGSNTLGAIFNWNFNGGNIVSGSGAGPYVVNWSGTGNYTVSLVVVQNGCPSDTSSVLVNVGTPPIVDAGPDQTICSGGSIQIGSTPIAGYTYSWDDGSVLDDSTLSNPTFSFPNLNPAPQVITLTVTANENGCTNTDQVSVTVSPPGPTTIIALGNTTFCQGNNVELESSDPNLVATIWTTGEQTPFITVDSSGQFGLLGIDVNGCLYVSNVISTTRVPNPIVSSAPNGIVNETCTNYNDGSITVVASSGTPLYNYTWSTSPTQQGPTASNLGAGSYSVTVEDNNNCTTVGNFSVQAAVVFGLNIDSVFDASCFGFSNGRIFTTPQGGRSPYRYVWSNGRTSRNIGGLTAGNYTVTASEGNGCTTVETATIAEPAEIVTNVNPNIEIKFLESTIIDLTVTPSSANYNYIWTPASSLNCADCEDPEASPVRTTTYTVVVTDQNTGCSDTSRIKVQVDATKNLYIPNAFTPNQDTRNDEWKVFSKGVKFFEAKIFNRWGELVYQSNDINQGWDGTFKGSPVSLGVYPYEIQITFLDNEVVNNKGTITILK